MASANVAKMVSKIESYEAIFSPYSEYFDRERKRRPS